MHVEDVVYIPQNLDELFERQKQYETQQEYIRQQADK
jgi:hypothetical protein